MQAHPAWPALDWLKKRSEESLFGDRKSDTLIKIYFSGVDPRDPGGKAALARALTNDGRTGEAAALVRAVWREADLNAQLEAKVRSDFGFYLDKADHKFRADRLLYKDETAAAFRAAALAGPDVLALAKARAAVIDEAPSDKLLANVPPALRTDPGYLYAQIHKLRHADKIRTAADILVAAPRDPALIIDGDEWWIEHLADEGRISGLASLVARRHDAHLSLNAGKIIRQRTCRMDALAFPRAMACHPGAFQFQAAVYIVCSHSRPESAFDPQSE